MAEQLRRALKLPHLIFYGIGTMVGAGIYSVIGAAAGEAGPFLWISFLLAGTAAFLTVLSYAELASIYPAAGAEYQFLKNGFPERRFLSFLAGYLVSLSAAATAATVSLAFAGYLQVFIAAPIMPVAYGLILACTAINIAGIREATWVSIAMICIEVFGLLLVIWFGFTEGEIGNSFKSFPSADAGWGIFAASALIFFVYIGFEDVANLSEETVAPTRTVPRALVISVVLTSAIYLLVAISVIALAAPDALSESDFPLSAAVGSDQPWRADVLGATAIFATASTALIGLVSMSRMLFGMARAGDMPRPLARTLKLRRTPWVAALTLGGVACLLLPLGTVKAVASVSSFAVLLVFIGVQAAMIALRYRQPDLERPFRVPIAIGRLPVLPVIGIIAAASLLTQFDAVVYAVGAGALLLGLAIYIVHRRTGGEPISSAPRPPA